ncbi:MAG: glycosyltransferase family 39 protein [Acidobacteriota bacterium]|nr:glycosyltransferase family 39 protein [Acidobacteriota bacterium]
MSPKADSWLLVQWDYCVLSLLMMIATALRFHAISDQPLWYDEAITWAIGKQTPYFIVFHIPKVETNPFLFYIAIHYTILIFGETEFALRLLSALATILAVPVVYFIGRAFASKTTGVIGAALLAVNPISLQFAQEARAYAAVSLFEGLATFGLLLAVSNTRPTSSATFNKKYTKGLLIFSLFSVLSFYLHYTYLFFIVICYIVLLFVASVNFAHTNWRHLLLSMAFVLICLGPGIHDMLLLAHAPNIAFMVRPSVSSALDEILANYGFAFIFRLRPFLSASFVLSTIIYAAYRGRHCVAVLAAIGLVIGFPALLYLISFFRPIFRYNVITPPVVIFSFLAGFAISSIPNSYSRRGAAVLASALMLMTSVQYYSWNRKDANDKAVQYVERHIGNHDIVVGTEGVFYYRERYDLRFPFILATGFKYPHGLGTFGSIPSAAPCHALEQLMHSESPLYRNAYLVLRPSFRWYFAATADGKLKPVAKFRNVEVFKTPLKSFDAKCAFTN